MDPIRRQVAQARRRLVLQQFLGILPWSLFVALLIAAIALAVPKIWVIAVDPQAWLWGWIGGACGVGLLFAVIWTAVVRQGMLDAAVEVDRRFGLKERVSSAMMMLPEERSTEIGRALIDDASRRVEMVVVKEKFQLTTGWRPLLPVGLVVGAFALAFLIPDAQNEKLQAATAAAKQQQQVKKSNQELKERLAKKQEEAQKKGLQDAEELFRKITQGIDEMNKSEDVDQRKALVKLNDLAKELAQRGDAVGDKEKLKQQFDKLKDLEKGPADKLADAMKEGNFEKAIEELNKLTEQMAKGELSKEDQKKLTEQLAQMKQQLKEMAEAHREAKQELQRKIEQKAAQGDREAVNKLQKQLDQLEKADKQMSRMESMAAKCEACEQAMKSGDAKEAASKLSQLQKDLESIKSDIAQLETISEIMDELADAKDSMRGDAKGEGKSDQYSMQQSEMDQLSFGDGMGKEGKGAGYRPEQETATGTYESRQRATPKKGQAVRIGDAGGLNQPGLSLEEAKAQILTSLRQDPDPLTDQRLPRSQQDHVKEYYQRLRKGE